jgi:hypothetical protein
VRSVSMKKIAEIRVDVNGYEDRQGRMSAVGVHSRHLSLVIWLRPKMWSRPRISRGSLSRHYHLGPFDLGRY